MHWVVQQILGDGSHGKHRAVAAKTAAAPLITNNAVEAISKKLGGT